MTTDTRLPRSVFFTWWNNVAGASVSVSKMRRDGKFPLLTDTHIRESLVPALDHLTDTQLEGEWLVTVITETMRHTSVSRYVPYCSSHCRDDIRRGEEALYYRY
jgi:hypothetical protein